MMASSGSPFNITVGQDLNGDSIFNDRPAFAAAGATGSNIVATQVGQLLTPVPLPGEKIIPVNYGTGPGMFEMNVRAQQNISFGRTAESAASSAARAGRRPGGGRGGPPAGWWRSGPRWAQQRRQPGAGRVAFKALQPALQPDVWRWLTQRF